MGTRGGDAILGADIAEAALPRLRQRGPVPQARAEMGNEDGFFNAPPAESETVAPAFPFPTLGPANDRPGGDAVM